MSKIKVVDKRDDEVKVEFRGLGGKIAKLDLRCCFESDFILNNYVKKGGYKGPVPIRIPEKIIELVNEFCVKRWETINGHYDVDAHHLERILRDFDWDFASKQALPILILLAQAACKLRVKSLLNVVHDAIVARLASKSDEIKLSKISGLTQKELEEAMGPINVGGAWGYEQMVQ